MGVSAIALPEGVKLSFDEFEAAFVPRVPGGLMPLDGRQVRVDVESRVNDGMKEYLVDIVIETSYSLRYSSRLDEIRAQIVNGAPEPVRAKVLGLSFLLLQMKHEEKKSR